MSNVTSSVTVSTTTAMSEPAFVDAFERTAPARKAIPATEVLPINLEVPTTVAAALGALSRVKAIRSSFVSMLPSFDMTEIGALESYADGLTYAHLLFSVASEPSPELPAMHQRASELREQLAGPRAPRSH